MRFPVVGGVVIHFAPDIPRIASLSRRHVSLEAPILVASLLAVAALMNNSLAVEHTIDVAPDARNKLILMEAGDNTELVLIVKMSETHKIDSRAPMLNTLKSCPAVGVVPLHTELNSVADYIAAEFAVKATLLVEESPDAVHSFADVKQRHRQIDSQRLTQNLNALMNSDLAHLNTLERMMYHEGDESAGSESIGAAAAALKRSRHYLEQKILSAFVQRPHNLQNAPNCLPSAYSYMTPIPVPSD
mmetsp:Transcript_4513/g.17084  ORF Transcript_4513/g.17084 Transcript_4513/m.17084 type:complete len:245 (+) Transcript_4513:1826-2560(+)